MYATIIWINGRCFFFVAMNRQIFLHSFCHNGKTIFLHYALSMLTLIGVKSTIVHVRIQLWKQKRRTNSMILSLYFIQFHLCDVAAIFLLMPFQFRSSQHSFYSLLWIMKSVFKRMMCVCVCVWVREFVCVCVLYIYLHWGKSLLDEKRQRIYRI